MKACKPGRKGQQRLQLLQTQHVFEACSKGRVGQGSSSAPFFMGHKSQVVCSAGREFGCFQVVLFGGSSSPPDPLVFPSLGLPGCCAARQGVTAECKDRGVQVISELLSR